MILSSSWSQAIWFQTVGMYTIGRRWDRNSRWTCTCRNSTYLSQSIIWMRCDLRVPDIDHPALPTETAFGAHIQTLWDPQTNTLPGFYKLMQLHRYRLEVIFPYKVLVEWFSIMRRMKITTSIPKLSPPSASMLATKFCSRWQLIRLISGRYVRCRFAGSCHKMELQSAFATESTGSS